jgi:hypothetical protein
VFVTSLDSKITDDIRRVANELGRRVLSRTEYVQKGKFTLYQVYEGGATWEQYCLAAGIATRKKEPVPDEVYFDRLKKAHESLARYPKSSERKMFGLNFSKRRYPTLSAFIARAAEVGYVDSAEQTTKKGKAQEPTVTRLAPPEPPEAAEIATRPVPPIPVGTKQRKWERTGVEGFPYAPQDESGVVALFAILCARRELGEHDWSILELRQGKGIDLTCYDHKLNQEIRVELKHRLSKSVWDKRAEDVNFVVCWESAWPDFPKPVVILRELLPGRSRRSQMEETPTSRKNSASGT